MNETSVNARPYKLGTLSQGDAADKKFIYPPAWWRERLTRSERLKVTAMGDHIDLILKLMSTFQGPFYVLYELLVSRVPTHKTGRYQSPAFDRRSISDFANHFKDFFQLDGRHNIWFGAVSGNSLLVYDQHNILYAYGVIENYIGILLRDGFCEREVHIPTPHVHRYHDQYDHCVDEVLQYWNWKYSPLKMGNA